MWAISVPVVRQLSLAGLVGGCRRFGGIRSLGFVGPHRKLHGEERYEDREAEQEELIPAAAVEKK
jgi:hypothetical protein